MTKTSNKTILIFLIVSAITISLLTSGCSGVGGQKKENKEQLPEDYRTGTQGLYMEFMPNMPPAKLYAEDPESLQVLVRIQNKGAQDILSTSSDMRIQLQGFDPRLIPMTPDQSMLGSTLAGKSTPYPQGAMGFMQWKATAIEFPGNTFSPVFQATVCYKYQTIATPLVCIDPNPYTAIAQDKVCTVHDIPLAGGQGGPVAVTKIEESINQKTKKVLFRIYVANVGGGTVLSPTSARAMDNCRQKTLGVSDIDRVKIRPSLGKGPEVVCSPDEIFLINGQGVATCEMSFADVASAGQSQTAYLTQLKIILDYGYTSSISKPVQIITMGTARDGRQNP